MRRRSTAVYSLALFSFGLAWGTLVAPAFADRSYILEAVIPVPAGPANPFAGGQFTTYDIGFVDSTTQLYYLADRTNASIDIFSAATNMFVGRIGGFQGIQPPPPAAPINTSSGAATAIAPCRGSTSQAIRPSRVRRSPPCSMATRSPPPSASTKAPSTRRTITSCSGTTRQPRLRLSR